MSRVSLIATQMQKRKKKEITNSLLDDSFIVGDKILDLTYLIYVADYLILTFYKNG